MPYRRKPDSFTRKAHQKNYPARSIFKLEEIDKKWKIIKKGMKILELGCSPGSWLKYASQKVGTEGTVVGVDIEKIQINLPKNSIFLHEDIYTITPEAITNKTGVAKFDCILSDLAPRTTGIKNVDQENSWQLFSQAVKLAVATLKSGGSFVGKIFHSPYYPEVIKIIKQHFKQHYTIKTKITRKGSSEIFIIGKDFTS